MSHSKRLLAAAILLTAGCSNAPQRAVERLAIFPIENLTGDTRYDWVAGASHTMLPSQLASSAKTFVFAAGSRPEASRRRATRWLAGYLTLQDGKLAIEASVEDTLALKRITSIRAEGRPEAGLIPLLDAVSKRIDAAAPPYSTSSEAALQKLAAGDAPAAIQADNAFVHAWLVAALDSRNRGDRAGAIKLLDSMPAALQAKISPVEKAQFGLLKQSLGGSPEGRQAALAELAKSNPNDPELFKQLAESASRTRDFNAAANYYKSATMVDPDGIEYWNWLGYAQAMAGNVTAAVASMAEYAKRSPNDPNPFDSLGEINYYSGKFADAEAAFLAAHSRNPGFVNGLTLFKAAQSRLLMGDVKAADDLFAKYSDLLKQVGDPVLPVRQAIWDWMAGRRKAAIANLETVIREGKPQLAAIARSQLAVLHLIAGKRDDARKLVGPMTPISQFLIQPSATAEMWRQRVAALNAPDPLKQELLAYSLLLDGHHAEAIPVLEAKLKQTNPFGAESTEELLAWALVSAGRPKDAKPYLAHWPLPSAESESFVVCVTFPRMVETRAIAFEREGDAAKAAKLRELYKKLTTEPY